MFSLSYVSFTCNQPTSINITLNFNLKYTLCIQAPNAHNESSMTNNKITHSQQANHKGTTDQACGPWPNT